MKFINKLTLTALTALLGVTISAAAFSASAAADCYQYNANGFTTSATPVFNNICGVPEGINNESDFVRVRPDITNNDEDNDNNPAYTVGTLTSACTTGSNYDVWNYLHNDASTAYNPDVNPSNPSAVAHDVQESLTAQFGSGSKFTFGDTITASNAASVSDTATLDCGNSQVQLSLVPGSVHIYSIPYAAWENLPDGTVNGGPTTVGSTSTGGLGSGDQWGCWNYRIVIVYEVQVTPVKPVVVQPTCNLLTLESSGQVAKVEGLDYSAGSSTVSGATIQFLNGGTVVNTVQLTPAQIQNLSQANPLTYTFANTGDYTVNATLHTSLGDVAPSGACVQAFTASTPPVTPTTPVTPASTPTSSLVNTGPGDVAAIFAGAVVAGVAVYQWILRRKLAKN